MPSLWIINQCFYPDIDATGQMMTDLAEDLVKKGFQITVITGQNQKNNSKKEKYNGVNIIRVLVARFNKKVLFYRYLNYLSLFPSILIKALFMPKPDYILIVSSPPFMFFLGGLLKILKGSKLIFNVQDLYPDIAINLRLIRNPFLINLIRKLVLKSYKMADKIICVGEKMQGLLIKRGVPTENISTIHNWADGKLLYPREKTNNYFIDKARLLSKFIIQYSGNFGMVHEIDTILQAAKALSSYHDIHFIFIGGGVQADKIRLFIKNNNLSNTTIFPFQKRKDLNLSLNASDVSVVTIKKNFEGIIVPSKIFGIMAVGKPVLAICHSGSELADIVEKHKCGVVIPPGDIDRCVKQILLMYHDKEGRISMGNRAHQALLDEYERSLNTQKYFEEIQKLHYNAIDLRHSPPGHLKMEIKKTFDFDLSICIVNHNAKELTIDCIRSIYDKTKNISFEIILVDNNSSDGSSFFIAKLYPTVKIIENKINFGFAKANNQAIKSAQGEYIFLLNNDTILKNNALGQMVAFMKMDPKLGLLTCKIYGADGEIQKNCRSFPLTPLDTFFGRASILSNLFPDNPITKRNLLSGWNYNSIQEIDWISGAAMMARRKVFEQVGLLDEYYYMYWEDADISKRVKNAGWKIIFIPEAEIIHFTGKGGGNRSLLLKLRALSAMHRSAYHYFLKHHYKSALHPMAIIIFIGIIPLMVIKGINVSIKHLTRF